MIPIIYEDNHLLVVEKPENMPVQADQSQDQDLLNLLKEDLKTRYNKPGEAFLGLVHRLDRPVGGVMVFAKTSKAASRLSDQIRRNRWKKKYYAVTQQFLEPQQLDDLLLKDRKTNTTTINPKGKPSTLIIQETIPQVPFYLLDIDLITGRSHQIRVQLAHRKAPIWGDQRYNLQVKVRQQIALYAYELQIEHPTTKKVLTFRLALPDRYPFNQFLKPEFEPLFSTTYHDHDGEQ